MVTFKLVIDGLRTHRKLTNPLKKSLKNATIINKIIGEQSINFAVEYRPISQSGSVSGSPKVYRFQKIRLPSKIIPDKCRIDFDNDKIFIKLKKTEAESWRNYVDRNFETADNFKR
jgi:hypothetical protein